MLKPTRTILALATGSLVLGLVGTGAAVADDGADAKAAYRVTGKVVSKGPLKVRSKPTTHSKAVGHVYPHSKVDIKCKKYGEKVDGNRIWYRLAEKENGQENSDWQNGGGMPNVGAPNVGMPNSSDAIAPKAYDDERWVSARYVKNLGDVKYCR
uniref:SH3b domain-containing protein n=1 Tax=Streptomyces sp. NBC_00049 TaxID=2903617 RepID=A0AAU2K277_9ACTN